MSWCALYSGVCGVHQFGQVWPLNSHSVYKDSLIPCPFVDLYSVSFKIILPAADRMYLLQLLTHKNAITTKAGVAQLAAQHPSARSSVTSVGHMPALEARSPVGSMRAAAC